MAMLNNQRVHHHFFRGESLFFLRWDSRSRIRPAASSTEFRRSRCWDGWEKNRNQGYSNTWVNDSQKGGVKMGRFTSELPNLSPDPQKWPSNIE